MTPLLGLLAGVDGGLAEPLHPVEAADRRRKAHPRKLPSVKTFLSLLAAGIFLIEVCAVRAEPGPYFAIQVVDEATGRGVPMVELQTTSGARCYTDSNGLIAFYEPGLMNKKVWFGVSSHGYEFPPDGLGIRGVTLETKPGGSAQLKIKRLDIAERLYRITGQGIYRDTVLLGRKPPIAEPLLNAEVTGQDGILNAIYRGRLYWFYGDTSKLSYALGNFSMTGATTELPDRIDPSVGFNLKYFAGKDGFVKPMATMEGEGVVWLFGLVVLPDPSGRERMLAYFQRRRGLGAVLENGFVVYNDETDSATRPAPLPHGLPLSRPTRAGDRVPLLHRSLSGLAGQGGLELVPRPLRLRGLHLPQAGHPVRRQSPGRTRPRRRGEVGMGVEERHAAAEPQRAAGSDRRRQNEARGEPVPAAGCRERQADPAQQLLLLLE